MRLSITVLLSLSTGCIKRPPPQEGYVVRKVTFEGNGSVAGGFLGSNSGISDYTLQGAMVQGHNGRMVWLAPARRRVYLDDEELRLDAWRLETWYAHHGYFNAYFLGWDVTVVQERRGLFRAPAVRITGRINEGEPTLVGAPPDMEGPGIEWLGFEDLSSRVSRPLLNRIRNRSPLQSGQTFTVAALNATEAVTMSIMVENTFARAKVDSEVDIYAQSNSAHVQIVTEPGPSCTFGELELVGSFDIPREIILAEIAFKEGEPYKASKLNETQQRLFSLGAFSVVNVIPLIAESEGSEIPVTISLTERKPKQLQIGGGLLSESSKQSVYGSTTFQHVNLGNRLIRFDGELTAGYAVIGAWDLVDSNNTEERFDVSDQGVIYGAEGTLRYPRAFGLPKLSLELSGGAEKVIDVNYAYFSPEIAPGLSIKINKPLMLQLSYQLSLYTYSKYDDGTQSSARFAPEIGERVTLSELNQSLIVNTRDNPLSTRKGFYGLYEVTEAGGLLQGTYSFLRLHADQRIFLDMKGIGNLSFGKDEFGNPRRLRQIIGWSPDLVFAGRASGGLIIPYGEVSEQLVPLQERMYLGGSSDVRGWSRNLLGPYTCDNSPEIDRFGGTLLDRIQDPAQLGYGCSNSKGYAGINDSVVPIGGLYAMNFSLELRRYFVDDTYGLVVFGDMGMVFLDQDELVSEWNRWRDSRPNLSAGDPFLAPTVGLGLRYNTPIGPVRVDGGYRLDNDERYLFEQKFRFHLALGETF